MPLYSYEFHAAQDNFSKVNRFSRWFSKTETKPEHAAERMNEPVVLPAVTASKKIKAGDTIFTIGSCFAREVERSLTRLKQPVSSLPEEMEFGNNFHRGFVNRYNTASIRNELEWAAGTKSFPQSHLADMGNGKVIDLQSHPVGGPATREIIAARRENITNYFSRALTANFVTVTLGLIEGWYDNIENEYIGFAPVFGQSGNKRPLLSDDGRFEFRVMDFEENMANLDVIFSLIKKQNPECHIIVTVSPVPLSATFSERDVIVANMLSKSMLRTCAETWVQRNPGEISYFPSYEIAMLSDSKVVWQPDKIHVRGPFVDEIMKHFIQNFMA